MPALHATRTEPNVLRVGARHRDEEGRRRPGRAGIQVVLGKPIAPVPELLRHLHEVERVAQGPFRIGTRHHRDQIEYPERDVVARHAETVFEAPDEVRAGPRPR